ncbi:hypothetical protein NNJEOMEG_03313 [Fundidesulfovibrio magnetotacticus]|uniref:Lipoprotein n=1 Tax=Fundidesulfovibrio magnetotacticus TaxID=2730080 RepID=A0A6V8LX31_9BACT|nr:hypothetical protein [Fundidesulfovibrio magnetotacticus]GFK95450.1 hypothetical protein NNJEOMEG_03313 [Fundidesulfovibrio magnetotacticus]
MKRSPLFILAALILLAASLSAGCAASGPSPSAPEEAARQAEAYRYGITFLRESKDAVVAQVEAEKAANPSRAAEIDARLGPALKYYSSAVDAYDAAAAREKQEAWDTARFLLTGLADTALRVGVPLAVQSLTR